VIAGRAHAVISVNSVVSTSPEGARAQAVITNPTGFDTEGGGTITAVAIKQVNAAIFVIDNVFGDSGGSGLAVNKRMLTAAQAYGLDLPFGYNVPPTTDPTGPWFGLVWPYRDQYDYFNGPFDPLGDDVGTPFTIAPNIYGFLDVDAIARGGPTDPTPAGGDVGLLLRGITGNGLSGPATYFAFDIMPLSGDPNRFVTVRILSATARVVVQNQAGAYSEIQVQIPAYETLIQLPEPASALALCALCSLRRSRRR